MQSLRTEKGVPKKGARSIKGRQPQSLDQLLASTPPGSPHVLAYALDYEYPTERSVNVDIARQKLNSDKKAAIVEAAQATGEYIVATALLRYSHFGWNGKATIWAYGKAPSPLPMYEMTSARAIQATATRLRMADGELVFMGWDAEITMALREENIMNAHELFWPHATLRREKRLIHAAKETPKTQVHIREPPAAQ